MEKVENLLITLTENLKYMMDDKNAEKSELLEKISSHSKDQRKSDWEISKQKTRIKDKDLPEISLQEVWEHSTFDDAWIVIYDKVYDITDFVMRHPGGEDVFHGYIGYDGTIAFRGVGHSSAAMRILEKRCIGVLPQAQKLGLEEDQHETYDPDAEDFTETTDSD